jgi:hypothetical protein
MEGIPIRTTLDNDKTIQYAALITQLAAKARSVVRDLDPQVGVAKFLRWWGVLFLFVYSISTLKRERKGFFLKGHLSSQSTKRIFFFIFFIFHSPRFVCLCACVFD